MSVISRSPARISVRSGDLDEAREVGSRIYHRHRVTVTGNARDFGWSIEGVSLGPLTVGWLTYQTPVRLSSAHEGSYQVNVPTAGALRSHCGGREVVGHPGLATVFGPDREAVLTGWQSPAPVLGVRISQRALEREMEQLLDRPVRHAVELEMSMDVATGRGAQWLALVRSLAADLTDEDSLLRQPMVAAPFAHSVMTALLLTTARHQLAAPPAPAGATAVQRAREYIDANAGRPLTVTDIARACGVGVRGLQQDFHRRLGISPTEYLRQVRLREVHRELLAADPVATTVGTVAARWGFAHQGRFAAQYRQRFGANPGETLRKPA